MGGITQIKEKLKSYLTRSIQNHDLKDDDDIIDLGLVHSLFLIQLILFIEKEYGFELEEEDLSVDNYRTINNIAEVINAKLA